MSKVNVVSATSPKRGDGITVLDVARRAGVAPSTVSLVMNGKGRVAAVTRKHVLASAAALSYRVDHAGKMLREKRSRVVLYCVGFDVSFDQNPVQYKIFSGVLAEASRLNCHVMWCRTSIHDNSFTTLMGYNPCGVIAMALSRETVSSMRKYQPDLVVIESPADMVGVDYICVDNVQVGYLAMRRLIEMGHRNIQCFTATGTDFVQRERLDGCGKALREAGITKSETSWVRATGPKYVAQDGYDTARKALQARKAPTAIFVAAGDPVACGVVRAARDLGVRVPEDLSVVGCDDTIARWCSPRLATIGQPLEEFGKLAMQRILHKLEGSIEGHPLKVLLPPVWVDGGTVAKVHS